MPQVALSSGVAAPPETVLPRDVHFLRTGIVNVYLVGPEGAPDRGWTLVDCGMYGYTGSIVAEAAERFGAASRPAAIILTHGHFDHVGALRELAEVWDVPVYAHPLERPYLDGTSGYPPPDPSVGGGAMALLSWAYPRGPVDVGHRLRPLPGDGEVPGMAGWRWLHTPGHAPGHVSLFRESDRTLIAGDAVTTVKQESALAVMAQRPEIHGPPMYYTPDWGAAAGSVRAIAELRPEVVATGHGIPVAGEEVRAALRLLADDFRERAMPRTGRYVYRPAVTDERGVVSLPPPAWRVSRSSAYIGLAAAFTVGLILASRRVRR